MERANGTRPVVLREVYVVPRSWVRRLLATLLRCPDCRRWTQHTLICPRRR